MSRTARSLVVLVLLAAAAGLLSGPADGGQSERPTGLPAGRGSVEVANGVSQVCEIRTDGTACVVEPQRTAGGRGAAEGGSFVIAYDDDRVERWTPVGRRLVVEHWFPASQRAAATPVLGIADQGRSR